MKKIIALVLTLCLLAISLSPISVFATEIPEELEYIKALDLSVLTPGSYRDTAPNWDGTIDLNSEIITKGIWVDTEESKGFGNPSSSGKTNFHGFIANDTDSDMKTDNITAIGNDDLGMSITLGFNNTTSFEGTTAIAFHFDNTNADMPWGNTAYQGFNEITLYDSEENAYTRAQTSGAFAYVVDLANNTVNKIDTYAVNFGYWIPKTDMWYVLDLAVFGDNLNVEDITKVKISLPTYWSQFAISEIGFVNNATRFVNYLTTGEVPEYEKPIPAEATYTQLLDLSKLAPGNYYADGVFADTNGIFTNPNSEISGLTAYDSDGNGNTDLLEARITGSAEASFTLNFNTNYSYDKATALAVRINCKDAWEHRGDLGVNQDENEMSYVRVTFVDAEENVIPCASSPVAGANYNYVDLAGNLTYSEGHWNENIRYGKNADGWVIVDLAAFTDLSLADVTGLKITFPWNAWNNVGVSDIGLVDNTSTFIHYLETGKTPEVEPEIPAETGYRKALDLSKLSVGDHRDTAPNWDGTVADSDEIITQGIWIDNASAMGFGNPTSTGKTNIHGFHAIDFGGDGVTDRIEANVNDGQGAAFTLGFNSGNSYTGATAIAVHLSCNDLARKGWDGDTTVMKYIRFDFIDEEDNLIPIDLDVKGVYLYYVDLLGDLDYTREVTWRDDLFGANTDGWFIVDLAAFTGLDLNAVKGLKLSFLESNWNNIGIADIGFVDNANNFINYLNTGKIYTPEAPTPVLFAKGTDTIKLVATEGHKYSLDGENWVDTAVFTGLDVGYTYTVYEYIPQTSSSNASEVGTLEVFLGLKGDTDGNGDVDADDMVDVTKHLLGVEESNDAYAADANLDGTINILDFIVIKKLVA